MWSSDLHGADKIGYLSSGEVARCDATSNGMLHVGVLYSTGSLASLVEPVDIETLGTQVFHLISSLHRAGVVGDIVRVLGRVFLARNITE